VSGGCPSCGRPLDAHDRHVRFTLPDPVLATEGREHVRGAWLSHDDARTSVMMQIPGVGPFVRCLLAVRLSGGHSVTFGVWIGVSPDDLQRAFRLWWAPEYTGLVLDGRLANALPGWGLLAAPVRAAVRHPDETPYCISSPDPVLARVLGAEWPHEQILNAVEAAGG
jgi:hypothetical protein